MCRYGSSGQGRDTSTTALHYSYSYVQRSKISSYVAVYTRVLSVCARLSRKAILLLTHNEYGVGAAQYLRDRRWNAEIKVKHPSITGQNQLASPYMVDDSL